MSAKIGRDVADHKPPFRVEVPFAQLPRPAKQVVFYAAFALLYGRIEGLDTEDTRAVTCAQFPPTAARRTGAARGTAHIDEGPTTSRMCPS